VVEVKPPESDSLPNGQYRDICPRNIQARNMDWLNLAPPQRQADTPHIPTINLIYIIYLISSDNSVTHSKHPLLVYCFHRLLLTTTLTMPSALFPTFPQEVTAKRPWRILIVGAAYGGITALMHFIDLSNGNQRLDHRADVPNFEGAVPARGVDVTMLDERDGFCMFSFHNLFHHVVSI